jgi:hypothetical protein
LIDGVEDRFPDFDEGRANAHRSPIPQRPYAHRSAIALLPLQSGISELTSDIAQSAKTCAEGDIGSATSSRIK